nr:methyltransferase domain-containing protein [Pseudenhygromyxa sp. WMMC2535]
MAAPAPPAQKTGAYHDQRDNRAHFATLLGGEAIDPELPVLDLGCHVGGFALAAARAGRRVVAVDQSRDALAHARKNAAANGLQDRVEFVSADMFGALDHDALAGPFAAAVFDPPKIASSRRDLDRATGAMARTMTTLLSRLAPAGLLAACSCSHHLGGDALDRALWSAAERSGRACTRVASWGPGGDHPVWPGHVEGEYLRVAVYQRRWDS